MFRVTKAPSGRELDFAKQKTEGERVTIMLVQTQSHACSFRHAIACHLSLRLGHISALALSTQFTTEMPLRYLPEEGFFAFSTFYNNYYHNVEKTFYIP